MDPTIIEKIDQLNADAWTIRVSDSNKAFNLSNEALDLSYTQEYKRGIAEGLRTYGFCLIRKAEYAEALKLFKKARDLFKEAEDFKNLCVIHEYFGIAHRGLGYYEDSLKELYHSLTLSREQAFKQSETLALHHLSITYKYMGDLNKALEYSLSGLEIAREIKDTMPESYHLNCIGGIYYEMENYEEALSYYRQSLILRKNIGDLWGQAGSFDNIGKIFLQQNNYEDALKNCLQGLEISERTGDMKGKGNTLYNIGLIYAQLEEYQNALDYLQRSLEIRNKISDKKGKAEVYTSLGKLYNDLSFNESNPIKSLTYLYKALDLANSLHAKDLAYRIHNELSKTFKATGDYHKALKHYEVSMNIEKEVNNEAVRQKIINLQISHRVNQSIKEAEIYRLKNIELANLVEQIKDQKAQLQNTLNHLKSTQAQLIQSEKMASLGELTAGIAHEIQNPLNFVNNFSEVSEELIDEMQEEIENGDMDEVKAISNDLKENLGKITHHGKRAESIVKGMLLHSRSTKGEKVPTDINALCDEFLRLSYHGLRAKDRSFNADFKVEFDETIPKIEVIPQDMGRVMLNLINNAFQAISDRADRSVSTAPEKPLQGLRALEGVVKVTTKNLGDTVQISVSDNGPGIPDDIKDKIFQPFFTTKPTGEGTGLGLSLAYDIIKAHGGNIKLESAKNVGSVFTITLNKDQIS